MSSTDDFLRFLQFLDSLDELDPPSNIRSNQTRIENFTNYDDQEFFNRYRMTKDTVLFILNEINDDLEFHSDRNGSVPPVQQLLIALRFYGTGTELQAIAADHGVSVPTASRIVRKVSKALVKIHTKFIKMPTSPEEIDHSQREFYAIAKFPYVIGCIDCTHVKIQSPGGENAKLYLNEDGYFSVNVQTVTDVQLKVRNVVAHTPGATYDKDVFISSQLYQEFESGVYGNSSLLGDGRYSLKGYLLTPYSQPTILSQEKYNLSHSVTRELVERQQAVLLSRFPVLVVGLRINLQTAIDVIVACCVLHNICIDQGDYMPPDEVSFRNAESAQLERNNYHDEVNDGKRIEITHNFFS